MITVQDLGRGFVRVTPVAGQLDPWPTATRVRFPRHKPHYSASDSAVASHPWMENLGLSVDEATP